MIKRFVLVVLLQLLGALAQLAPLLAVAALGRELLGEARADHVRTIVLVGVFGLLLRLMFSVFASGLGHLLDTDAQFELRRALARTLGRVPIGWLSGRRTGELAKVVGDDVSAIHPVIAHTPGELITAFVIPLISLTYLVTIDWRLTLITLIPVVLAVALVPLMILPARQREQNEFDASMARIADAAVEFVQGIVVVKTFGGRAHQTFLTAADSFVTFFARWVRGISPIAAGMQLALAPPLVLAVVLTGAATLHTPPPDLLPFVLLGLGLTAPVAALGHGFDNLQSARRSITRIREVLKTPPLPEPQNPKKPTGHRVEFENVHFTYEPRPESGKETHAEPRDETHDTLRDETHDARGAESRNPRDAGNRDAHGTENRDAHGTENRDPRGAGNHDGHGAETRHGHGAETRHGRGGEARDTSEIEAHDARETSTRDVLRGINLVLEPGTVTALVGASGSGKSTLVQLLPRFFDPTSGAIRIGGVDLRDMSSADLYRTVSLVFQDVRLLRASVTDNIALAVPHADPDDIRDAARRAEIHDRILALPRGYDTVLGEETGLSGGEAQRIAIARALLADTPVLVLDEATSFADPRTERALRRAMTRDRTVLVIAHRPETIADADTVVTLENGVLHR